MAKGRKQKCNPFSGFRGEWPVTPVTRVVPNKRGKGSYTRKKDRRSSWQDTGSVCLCGRCIPVRVA